MRRVPVILTAFVGLVLLGASLWSIWAVREVSALREQLQNRVALSVQIQAITTELGVADRVDEVALLSSRIEELARTAAQQRGADDPVAAHARAAERSSVELIAIVEHAQGRASGQREAIARELAEIVAIVRSENAEISAELADHWSAINIVVALAVSLCGITTALLGYVLCVALPRAREAAERLDLLAARLAGNPTVQGISHGVGGPLTVAMTNLQLLRERFQARGVVADEDGRRLLDEALRSLGRATGTLQDMRGSSQLEDDPNAVVSTSGAPTLRILLIDDDEMVAVSTKRVLVGHAVETETDGARGLSRAVAGRFDLILCDLMMPGRGGIDVYRALQRERPELVERFVVMSGGANDPVGVAFMDEYRGLRLDKPFGTKELRELVARFTPLTRG